MKKGIMLVSPGYDLERRGIIQPLGIASVAGELEKEGYKDCVTIVDGCYLVKKYGYKMGLKKIEKEIREKRPFIVGCSFYRDTVDEVTDICAYAMKKGSHVILGGPFATVRHKKTAKELYKLSKLVGSSSVTAIVRGEGEKTAKELIDALYVGGNLRGIKGVTFFDGKRLTVNPDRKLADINELPPPAYHLLPPVSEYGYDVSIEESRGCVFKCSFCSITNFFTNYRLKTPERIRAEVANAKEIGARRIDFNGELILLERRRALKIADVMEEFGYEWKINAHPKLILRQKEILPTLRRKGLTVIETGIESANQNSLTLFNKGTTPRINENAIKILENADIAPNVDFITFQPYMNMVDLYKNLLFIIEHLTLFSNHKLYPEELAQRWAPTPGTPLFEKALADGVIEIKNNKLKVNFKDERVNKTYENYLYFLDKHSNGYHERKDKIIAACDKSHKRQITYNDDRLQLISKVPLLAFGVSWECARGGMPADKHIDSLVKRSFDSIDKGVFGSASEIIDSTYKAVMLELKEQRKR